MSTVTTTDIATRPAGDGWGLLADREPATRSVDLEKWVTTAQQVASVAEMLAKTSFVPKPFQGRPAECAAAILAGQECGFDPMASLRAIDVIQGKPALSALAQRAVVQGHGHELEVVESTETRAIVRGRRKGATEWQESRWTTDRARKMQLLGKDNWKNQPQAMLVARATAECARLIAADALLGMPYSAEELHDLEDGEPAPATHQPAAPPKRRTAQRKPLPAEAPEPAPGPEPELTPPGDDQPAEPPEGPHTVKAPQLKMIHALFREHGITDKDEGLQWIQEVIKRPIASTKELSQDEAARVIDDLKAASAADPAGDPPTDPAEAGDG